MCYYKYHRVGNYFRVVFYERLIFAELNFCYKFKFYKNNFNSQLFLVNLMGVVTSQATCLKKRRDTLIHELRLHSIKVFPRFPQTHKSLHSIDSPSNIDSSIHSLLNSSLQSKTTLKRRRGRDRQSIRS